VPYIIDINMRHSTLDINMRHMYMTQVSDIITTSDKNYYVN